MRDEQALSELEEIRANAAMVLTTAHDKLGQHVGYDEAGVRWLDGFIDRQRERNKPSNHRGLMNTLGAYLGECIVRTYGGEWARRDGSWGVWFDDKNAAFPFTKVLKHLENGPGDSVLSFFTMIPLLRKNRPPQPSANA